MATLAAATVAVNFTAGTADYEAGVSRATRSAESWERSLHSQIQAMEMGSDQARLYNLALKGADVSVRDSIRNLLDRKAALEASAAAEKAAADAAASAQRDRDEAIAKAQRAAADRLAQMQSRAATVYEQTRTPAEQYAVAVANLRDLLSRGAISQDTYNRALQQAQERMQQTSGAAQRAAEIQKAAANKRAAAEKEAADRIAAAKKREMESIAQGAAVFQQTRTPAERYKQTVGELSGLLRKGHIDQTTYSRAMANARNEMIQSSTAFQGLTGGLSGVLAATGPVGIAIGVAIAAVTAFAAAAAAAAVTVFNLGLAGGELIGKLLDTSMAMGITTNKLAELRLAAELNGSSSAALDASLQKMTQTLGDAVGGSDTAAKAFNRLGLNFSELAGLSPDQAFMRVAGAIAGIKNPYEQAAAAQDIFGKSYSAIMPLLKAGPEAFAEGAEKAKLFGLAVSQVDAARVDAAMDSFKQIGMIFDGIKQSLAVELAPIIQQIGDSFADLAESVGGVGPFISAFVEESVKALAAVGDTVMTLGKLYWTYLGEPINRANMFVMQGIKAIAGALGGLEYVLTGESKMGDAVQDVANSYIQQLRSAGKINDEAFKAWESRTFQDRTTDFFAGVKAKRSAMAKDFAANPLVPTMIGPKALDELDKAASAAQARTAKFIEDMQMKVETFGMSEKQIAIYKMALDGASAAEMAYTAHLFDKLDALKKQQSMMEEGKRLTESLRTEEEKRADQLAKYQELLESGAITQETYDRAVNKMNEQTAGKAMGSQEVQGIAAREIRFNASIPGAKRFTDELKAPAKETAKNTSDIARVGEETRDLIKERFGFDVVEIL